MRPKATWLERRIPDIGRVFNAVRKADTGFHVAVPTLFRLILGERYSPTEVYNLGLLRTVPTVSVSTFMSKRQLMPLQLQVNSRSYFKYTENKLVFFQRCMEHGLATPRVFAALGNQPFDSVGLPLVQTSTELMKVMTPAAPCEFVIKPIAGSHGDGVLVLTFDGTTFQSADGTVFSADDLFSHAAQWGYAKWLLQDRLHPHQELVALSGSTFIQTARVISCIDKRGQVSIPIAWLRIIASAGVFDNFNFGTSGNIVATIDVPTGRLEHVLGPGQPGSGLGTRTHHPVTGVAFSDFTIPLMPEIRDLITRAALAFKPLRTIGWDVAITNAGPVLIEGNVTWDPLPTRQDLKAAVSSLRE